MPERVGKKRWVSMAVVPFLQGGTSLGVIGYRSPRIIETAGEPVSDLNDSPP